MQMLRFGFAFDGNKSHEYFSLDWGLKSDITDIAFTQPTIKLIWVVIK